MTNNTETLITSSGIIRNASKPRVGVCSIHSLSSDVLDLIDQGVDLGWLAMVEEVRAEVIAELGAEADGLQDEIDNRIEDLCGESDGPVLFGAWRVGADGKYEVNPDHKTLTYAASYSRSSGVVTVEWSKDTTRCGHTSPCYVMADGSGPCGDLDSSGDTVVAFTLPADFFSRED